MGGLSIWHWLIVLLIVVLVFGTKRLKNIGTDMGGALKGFREAMNKGEDEAHQEKDAAQLQRDSSVQDTAAAKPLDDKDRQSS